MSVYTKLDKPSCLPYKTGQTKLLTIIYTCEYIYMKQVNDKSYPILPTTHALADHLETNHGESLEKQNGYHHESHQIAHCLGALYKHTDKTYTRKSDTDTTDGILRDNYGTTLVHSLRYALHVCLCLTEVQPATIPTFLFPMEFSAWDNIQGSFRILSVKFSDIP